MYNIFSDKYIIHICIIINNNKPLANNGKNSFIVASL